MRSSAVLGGVLAVLVLVAGCGSGPGGVTVVQGGTHGYYGALLDQPYAVPSMPLPATDPATKAASYDLAAAPRGQVRVVFFGYTRCPDTCQIVMSTIASAYTRLSGSQRKHVQVVFVTTDPARDTTKVLRDYLDRFNPDFVGVTGSVGRIEQLAKPMHVFLAKGRKLPSGGYEVDHSTSILADIGAQTRLVWGQDTSPAEMAKDLSKLLKDKT